jgi:hypothetical protein
LYGRKKKRKGERFDLHTRATKLGHSNVSTLALWQQQQQQQQQQQSAQRQLRIYTAPGGCLIDNHLHLT